MSNALAEYKDMVRRALGEAFRETWKAVFDDKSDSATSFDRSDFHIPDEVRKMIESNVANYMKWRT